MDEALKSNNLKRSLKLSGVKSAYKKHEPTVIQSVEGGHFMLGKLERLEVAYNKGFATSWTAPR